MIYKRWQRRILFLFILLFSISLLFFFLQRFFAHRENYFIPSYPRTVLTENSDYETFFLQTGLGPSSVDKLLTERKFETILRIQDFFFNPPKAECTSLLGWFTREDRFTAHQSAAPLVDLQPGDILVTLSTHTGGWRHGHSGIVINQNQTLECTMLGSNSTLVDSSHWIRYSNYAVLRLKDITPELQSKIVQFSSAALLDVPYRLSAGFIGSKAPTPDAPQFGLHCSYLVWYAWKHFGYDLDSDGGRLVSTYDLLHSDFLEVVQIYGMDPRLFL